ncbi:hypothetical protein KW459_16070 [Vibrio fluvialis]|nr:hypothetical protein [Vibrio fluvialis]
MSWTGFTIDGRFYDLTHLQTSTFEVSIDGKSVKLYVSYSSHCFTDEKGHGPQIIKRERRHWSHERYERSKDLPAIMQHKLLEHYAIPYQSRGGESYHVLEVHDYAIFFSVTKPSDSDNELKIKVNSAYELDTWGKSSLPKGKPKRVSWILSQRLQGKSVLKRS